MAWNLIPSDAASARPRRRRARTSRPRAPPTTTCAATTLPIETRTLDGNNKHSKQHNDNKGDTMLNLHTHGELRVGIRALAVPAIHAAHADAAIALVGASSCSCSAAFDTALALQRQQLHLLQLLQQRHVEQQQRRRHSGHRRRRDVCKAAASGGGRPPASRGTTSG